MAPASLAPSSPLSDLSESLFDKREASPVQSPRSNRGLRSTSHTPSPKQLGTSSIPSPESSSAMATKRRTSVSRPESPPTDTGNNSKGPAPRASPRPVTEAQPDTEESGCITVQSPTTPNPTIKSTRPSRTTRASTKPSSPSPPPPPPTPAAASTSKKRKAPTPVTKKITLTNKKRKAANAKWSVPFVYTDPKSPLVTADLRAILLHPKAWDCLEDQERREILGMLGLPVPADGKGEGEGGVETDGKAKEKLERPDLSYLLNRDEFRTDCRRYQEAIEAEQFDDGWLKEAWIAHERRRRGDFKAFLDGKLERDWGVKVPEQEEEQRKEEEEESPDSMKSVEMKSPSNEERSRETSGSHSTVSTVGEKFTRLKLGLRDEEGVTGGVDDGVDGEEGLMDDIVAAV